jgi:hypothetical protein
MAGTVGWVPQTTHFSIDKPSEFSSPVTALYQRFVFRDRGGAFTLGAQCWSDTLT